MTIETEGRSGVIYMDGVIVKRKNARVILREFKDGEVILATIARVATEKIKKKDLTSNQRLIKRMGVTVLVTEIAFSKESLNDLAIALSCLTQNE